MEYRNIPGVPIFEAVEYQPKNKEYVLLIPIINEGDRIAKELTRAQQHHIADFVDIVICDGGSTDGCTADNKLRSLDDITCKKRYWKTRSTIAYGNVVGLEAWI